MNFLRNNQIAYVPIGKLRKNFSPEFIKLANAKDKAAPKMTTGLLEILFAEAESCGFDLASTNLFILSEENFIGSPQSLYNNGSLYPGVKDNIHLLASIFADYEIQPFFALRNYSEFYPSAYAETLRTGRIKGHMKRFENYINELNLAGNSWVDVVEAIESAMGPARLWPYEQFQGNAHKVLSELLQVSIAPDMINADAVIRKSLTRKGLNVAMMSRDSLSITEMKRLVNLLAEKMLFEAPDEKISIKDNELAAFLNDKYKKDLEKLSSRLIVTE
ncbi:MAG: hypothetical protein ACXW0T_02530 [Methylobacter sp.]